MKKFALWGGIVAITAWFGGLIVFDYAINHFPADYNTKTDAIVVLTGGRHRLAESFKLLNDGLADRLFISGVQSKISLPQLERQTKTKIIDGKKVILDKRATNTEENAVEASRWIEENHILSIRLVTSNYHLLRSEVEFRQRNKTLHIILHPVFSEKVATSWWKSVRSFCFIAMEYNKFLFAYVRSLLI